MTAAPRLNRALLASEGCPLPAAPVRILHLGLGAFHRAHQAWYTARAHDAAEWGIAAFTGRSAAAAAVLAAQDGLYTLVARGPERDRTEVVGSIVEAVDGARLDRMLALFEDPRLALVTTTVTEAGYRLLPDGDPDPADAALGTDLDGLRAAVAAGAPLVGAAPVTPVGRLLAGLEARRRVGAGALAVVPCDNVPGNGPWLARGVTGAAELVDARLAAWITDAVSFVSTSVDRITPRTTAADVEALNRGAPVLDEAPVVTEPFADWVLSGRFPAGRPAWEDAGARFVEDIGSWERRKLWLLNGAHTLLAFAGPPLGHVTVAEAFADERLRKPVERFWDEASRHLPTGLELDAYRSALAVRFSNGRIEHRLEQIAQDGTRKLALRILPVAEAELAAGAMPRGCATAVAAWWRADGGDLRSVLASLSPALAGSAVFIGEVRARAAELDFAAR